MMFNYYLDAFRKNYFNFDGRARRMEYWSFVLFHFLFAAVFYFSLIAFTIQEDGESTSGLFGMGALLGIYFLASVIPGLAITVRRLHDMGKSGWWWFLSFVPFGSLVVLIFTLMDSEPYTNAWGESDKYQTEAYEQMEDDIEAIGGDLT